MKARKDISRKAQAMVIPMFLGLALIYTYYQMLTGERGLMTWYSLRNQVQELTLENTQLKSNVDSWEDKVARLKGDTLDYDYIDELARRTLPIMRPDETVVFVD